MSPRLIVKLAALASTCWLSIGSALAESRLALVIGNSSYTSVSALPNPANDARAMAGFLSSAGFRVTEAPNLSQAEMRRTIGNFASMVAEKGPDTIALVFYAGHGLQVDGENFLVPVDAQIEREADVPLQAMRLADLMNALSSVRSKSVVVILDACRNNPFSAVNKTSGRGLAIVDAPNGSLVSYSTAPGTEALDGDGTNSPFTTALLKAGKEPGLPIEQVLKRVRLDVSNATGRQQFPWESSSLTHDFSFFGPGNGQSPSGKPARSETRSVEAWQAELKSKSPREAYDIVVREDKVEAYQAYLALHPTQPATPTVRSLLDRRKVIVAWYEAVTINTVASYQTFLAAYGDSDFAATANRLIERARGRSIGNTSDAYASAAGTCPCNQPTGPAQRLRRTDYSPAPSSNGGGNAPSTSGPSVGPSGGSSVAVVSPPVTIVDPVPPVIVTPPIIVGPIYPRPPHVGRPHGDTPKPGGTTTGTGTVPTGTGPTGPGKGPITGTGTTGTGTTGTGTTGTGTVGTGPGKGPVVGTTTGTGNTGGGSGPFVRTRPLGNVTGNAGNASGGGSGNIGPRVTTLNQTPFKPGGNGSFAPMSANKGMGAPVTMGRSTGGGLGGGMGGGGLGMGRTSFGRIR